MNYSSEALISGDHLFRGFSRHAAMTKMFCIRKNIFSHRKKNLLFLSCNMAAVQNLYRLFPSSFVPLFQSESKYETIVMKLTLICMKMKLHACRTHFHMKGSHLDLNRGTRELGNGPLYYHAVASESSILLSPGQTASSCKWSFGLFHISLCR